MARAVGLDIGSRLVKVVELSGTPKAPKVQRLVIREVPEPPAVPEGELPPEPDALLSAAIRDIFTEMKLPKDDVCATFDAGVTVFREINVPFHDDDQIRKVVTFEAEHHLHSQSIDDVIVNFVKTGENKDGSRLTIFASPKKELTRILGICRGAGIEPASVDLDVTATFTAAEAAGVFQEHPNVILFDIGARSTTIVLVANGKPLVLRSFVLGCDQMERRLGRELALSTSETRRRARLPAGAQPDDLFVTAGTLEPPLPEGEKSLAEIESDVVVDERTAFVRKLHREALRSLASIRADATPDRVLLSGGGALLPDIADALSEKFDLPVEVLDLPSRIEFKDPGPDPELSRAVTPAAVGAGLRMMGVNPFGVELLRGEFAPTNTLEVVKTALATAVTLLFVLLLALTYVARERKNKEVGRYNYAAARAENLFKAAEKAYYTKVENKTPAEADRAIQDWLGRQPLDSTRAGTYLSRLKSRHRYLESQLGLASDIPKLESAPKVWLEVYRALNKLDRAEYGPWLRVVKMDVTRRSATVMVEVDDQAAFDKIRTQFENSDYFQGRAARSRVTSVGAMNQVQGHWRMEYEFRFKDDS